LAITAEGRLQAERILLDFAVIRRAPEKQIFSETDPPYVTEVPAADRYVFLNDNSTTFRDAVLSLESLVTEIAATRVNDWPEKEGILAAANAVLEMIKTKWVNKATVLAAISSLATFIVSKFAEAPISELANKAWAAVKALF
jgi:Tat protein secretion system quality control protein TatD with DNase activity